MVSPAYEEMSRKELENLSREELKAIPPHLMIQLQKIEPFIIARAIGAHFNQGAAAQIAPTRSLENVEGVDYQVVPRGGLSHDRAVRQHSQKQSLGHALPEGEPHND